MTSTLIFNSREFFFILSVFYCQTINLLIQKKIAQLNETVHLGRFILKKFLLVGIEKKVSIKS